MRWKFFFSSFSILLLPASPVSTKHINLFTSSWAATSGEEGFESITFFKILISLITAENYATFGRLLPVCVVNKYFPAALVLSDGFCHESRFPFIRAKTSSHSARKCFLIFQRWKQHKNNMPTWELISPKKVLLSSKLWINSSRGDAHKKGETFSSGKPSWRDSGVSEEAVAGVGITCENRMIKA